MALGVQPGPQVKALLQEAYDLQLGGHQRSGILKVLKRRLEDGTEEIIIKGARVNNLKNIDLKIPRGKLVIMTGLSGSERRRWL